MDIENDLLCFFNFRSPYAYIGIKKAIDLGLKPVFLPFCYVPKEILEAVTLNNPYKKDYLLEDCKRLFDEEKINLVDEIPADCNWPKVHAAWHIVNENNLDLGLNFMLKAFECRFQKGLTMESSSSLLERAFTLKKPKVVVININSPGGSPVQSELIYNKIRI